MRLNLLHIDDFIARNNLKFVTSNQMFSNIKTATLDNNGLWSETIFGLKGSKERGKQFGFINLNTSFIHPEVYNILVNINVDVKKLIMNKQKYTITKEKILIPDENGNSGITFFIENFKNIDLLKLTKSDKLEDAQFLIKNQNYIFITKLLVLPAGIRDVISEPNYTRIMYSEINDIYKEIVQNSLMLQTFLTDDLKITITNHTQLLLLKANSWIKNQMKGKHGLFRGLLLKKTNDFSARVVITIDPKIELGKIGVPWNVLFVIYEPFCFHHVMKNDIIKNEIRTFLKLKDNETLDLDKLKEFSLIVNKEYDTIPANLKMLLIDVIEEIVKGKNIIYKRDPVTTRYNWRSAEIIVTDSNSTILNPLDLNPMGGDIDGDQIALFALQTKEAEAEAKFMNPKYNKNIFQGVRSISDSTYVITKDLISTIYSATE